MNVSLPPDLKQWVDDQVKEGGYGTASEYLRDMLRRARERHARRKIDAMLIDAVTEGAFVEVDPVNWAADIRKAAKQRVKKAARRGR